jgi:putative ABC transport system permease protein
LSSLKTYRDIDIFSSSKSSILMFKNYLKTSLRYFIRNKKYVFINVAGLSIGVACCIIAYINFDFSNSFDAIHRNARDIYRLNLKYYSNGELIKSGIAPLPLYSLTKDNIPEVKNIVRYGEEKITLRSDTKSFGVNIAFTDPEFLDMFGFQFLHGNPSVLSDKTTMILTEKIARKYFGKTDVIGETFTTVINDQPTDYKVGAIILTPPSNGSFQFEVIAHVDKLFDYFKIDAFSAWDYNFLMFLHIPDKSKVDGVFKEIEEYNKQGTQYIDTGLELYPYPEPFYEMSTRPRYKHYWLNRGMPKYSVGLPLVLAIAILIIACINFTNTTIAIASRRLKEFGIRKVIGGVRIQLITQLLIEGLLISILALAFGLLLAELLTPYYSNMWPFLDLKLTYRQNAEFIGFLVLLLTFTALLAGGYPALYISKFQPASILKGQSVLEGSNWFVKGLLFIQFLVSIIMVVVAAGFLGNYFFQKDFKLGFNSDGVLYHYLNNGDEVSLLKSELLKLPKVKLIEGTAKNIYNLEEYQKFTVDSHELRADVIRAGPGYLDMLEIELLMGRNFISNSIGDQRESILINEAFAEESGWTELLGNEVRYNDSIKYYVIGVFRNIYSRGLSSAINPMALLYENPENYRQIMVKANATDLVDVEHKFGEIFREKFPYREYSPRYMDESVRRALELNKNVIFVFLFLGGVTLLLTGTGLYSLVSMNIARRTKEIGIRKVLGAKISDIVWQLNSRMAALLFFSFILGLPLGKLFADFLMKTVFFYHRPLNLFYLTLSIIIVLIVLFMSIAGKIRKSAIENPVNALRSE